MAIIPINEGFCNVKVTYGYKWAEVVEFSDPLLIGPTPGDRARPGRRGHGVPSDRPAAERLERDKANRERSIQRSRQTVRHKVKDMASCNPAVYMWTLTYSENMKDRGKAVRDWEKFCRELKKYIPVQFQYISVMETQKRGAWHFHVLTNVHIDVRQLGGIWKHGFVFVTKCNDTRHACRYILKYMTKAFDSSEKHQNRYLTSQGFLPQVAYLQVEGGDIREILDFLGVSATVERDGWFQSAAVVWSSYGEKVEPD